MKEGRMPVPHDHSGAERHVDVLPVWDLSHFWEPQWREWKNLWAYNLIIEFFEDRTIHPDEGLLPLCLSGAFECRCLREKGKNFQKNNSLPSVPVRGSETGVLRYQLSWFT